LSPPAARSSSRSPDPRPGLHLLWGGPSCPQTSVIVSNSRTHHLQDTCSIAMGVKSPPTTPAAAPPQPAKPPPAPPPPAPHPPAAYPESAAAPPLGHPALRSPAGDPADNPQKPAGRGSLSPTTRASRCRAASNAAPRARASPPAAARW